MTLKLTVGAKTDKGIVRLNNEDYFYIGQKSDILVVADGMGGHSSGEVASKMAVEVIKNYWDSSRSSKEPLIGAYNDDFSETTNRLGSAVRLANMAIYEAASHTPQWEGMGTTVAAAAIFDRRLSIAHVGDSRVYLIRSGDIEQLTDDHSLVFEQVKRDLISKEEAEVSQMKNILTRALGIKAEVAVDLSELTLTVGDNILLCSDGLTSMVSDDGILSIATLVQNPTEACNRLVEMANKNGGKDNITVIMATFLKEGRWFSVFSNFWKWFGR